MVLRFLLRIIPSGDKEEFLQSLRALASSLGSSARNPKWTSYGALEIDVFSPSTEDFGMFVAAVEPLGVLEFQRDLNQAPLHMTPQEVYAEAWRLFNSERYWECHEVLEGLWRNLQGEEKLLVQGVILVCAAFVHHQKGEEEVAFSILSRAIRQLAFTSPDFHGIDAYRFKDDIEAVLSGRRFQVFKV